MKGETEALINYINGAGRQEHYDADFAEVMLELMYNIKIC
jgi:hypothetical protein